MRVDVVDRKQARNPLTARGRRNETRHPVVAVDEVWLHVRNDVIDDLALERECQLHVPVALRINSIAVVEATVFRQMDTLVGQVALVLAKLVGNELSRLDMKHATIMGKRHMHVRPKTVQRLHERSRHVRHTAGFGGHLTGQVPHALRQIRDLRGNDENSRILDSLFC